MSCCRYPTKCCTAKYTEPELPDECRCGRGANNGIVQVLLCQLFLFAGLWSSAATIGDCGLVKLAEPLLVRADNVTTTSIGLLSYFDPASGRCYYWGEDEIVVDDSLAIKEISSGSLNAGITGVAFEQTMDGNEQLEYYLRTVLGEDWYAPLGLLCTSFGLAVIMFLYGTSLYCSTQVKACRCFAGLVVGVLMCLLQLLGTIFVYTSDWCHAETTQCQIHRDTWFSIAATCAFLFAGICFWTMEHWPGQQVLDELEEHRFDDSDDEEYPRKKKNKKKESSHRLHSAGSRRRGSASAKAAHQYSKKDRGQNKNQPRSFSGNAWVIEVEKSAAETSRDDLEEYEEYDDVEEPSRPAPRRKSQSSNKRRPSKMKQVGNVAQQQQQREDDYYHVDDEEQPPQRHRDRDRERRDRYNDEPQSPHGGKRRSSTTKKPRRSSNHRSSSSNNNNNNNYENSLYGHRDPSGMVVDATNSTYADHEESAHIEAVHPTYND